MIETFGLSDVGCIRELNEDCFCIHGFEDGNERGFCILADGMGGHNAGEVASQSAVKFIAERLKGVLDAPADAEIPAELTDAIERANDKVYRMSAESTAHSGMGTTVVAAYIDGGAVYVANVGDSRAYVVKSDGMDQITTDHSVVEELVKSGTITHEEARVHPQRNIITRAVGTEPSIRTDVFECECSSGDVLLLCSDGLSTMLKDDEIEAIIKREETLEKTVCNLVDAAKERGGLDNITVICIRFR